MKEKIIANLLSRTFFLILPIQGILSIGPLITYFVKFLMLSILTVVCFSEYRNNKNILKDIQWTIILILSYGIVTSVSLLTNEISLKQVGLGTATILAITTAPAIYISGQIQDDIEAFVRQCWIAYLIGFFITFAISLAYYLCGCQWLLPPNFFNLSARFYGVINSPNAMAVFAALTIGGTLIAHHRRWFPHFIDAISMVISSFTLLTTLSKATFIAFAVAAVAWHYLATKMTNHRIRLSKCLLSAALLGMLLGTAAVIWKQHENPRWRDFNPKNPLMGTLRIRPEVAKTGSRMQVWKAGTRIFLDNWITGIGVTNWKKELAHKGYPGYRSPHNGLLEMAGGMGIGGVILYLLEPFFVWRTTRRFPATLKGTLARSSLIAMLLLYIAREQVAVSGIFSYTIIGLAFWGFTGLLLLLANSPSTQQDTSPHQTL